MSLTNKVQQFNENSDLIDQWVNGDKNTEIQTAGGSVPSVAKLSDGIQRQLSETIEQQRTLEQRLGASTGAGLIKTSSGKTVQEELGAKASVNGNSGSDFYGKNLIASGGNVTAGGGNTINMAGAAAGIAPSIITAGASTDVGLYFGAKGGGRFDFFNGAGRQLQIGGYTASASLVNFYRIYGAPTGANPTMVAEGSDPNVGFDFSAKGGGEFVLRSNGGIQLIVGNAANSVNWIRAYGAAAGSTPTLESAGSDANIAMNFNAKGTGALTMFSGGRIGFQVGGIPNSVNFLQVLPNVSGQAAVLKAAGTDTNIPISIQPKGTSDLFVEAGLTLTAQAGTTERRLNFATAAGSRYLFSRDSDGVTGLHDGSSNVSAWTYAPATKTLLLGGGGVSVNVPNTTAPLGAVNLQTMQAAIASSGSSSKTGDVVMTMRKDYSAPDWLPCNGNSYLRSSYPALAALLGVPYPDIKLPVSTFTVANKNIYISKDNQYYFVPRSGNAAYLYKRTGNNFVNMNMNNGSVGTNRSGAMTPDGTYLAISGATSPFVQLYKRTGDSLVYIDNTGFTWNTAYSSGCMEFSHDGEWFVAGAREFLFFFKRINDVYVYQTAISNSAGLMSDTMNPVNSISFSPDGQHMAVAGTPAFNGQPNHVAVFKKIGDAFTRLTIARPGALSRQDGTAVAYSADSQYLFAGTNEPQGAFVFKRSGDTYSLLPFPVLPSHVDGVKSAAFSPDGNFLAVGFKVRTDYIGKAFIVYKRVGDSFIELAMPQEAHQGFEINALAFSPDTNTLVVGSTSANADFYWTGTDAATMFRTPVQEVPRSGIVGYIKT